MTTPTKAGFIAIIGLPNAGKSTLLNALLGEQLAIVSPKVQTTRVNLRGVLTVDNTQYIFVDTPGIHKPRRSLDQAMVEAAWQALSDADAVIVLIDARKGYNSDTKQLLEALQETFPEGKRPPLLCVLNKVDLLDKPDLLPLMAAAGELNLFDEIFAISATKKSGVQTLLNNIGRYLPESPFLYDEDALTDMSSRMLAAEMTRERAFLLLGQELPYALSVETVGYEELDNGSVKITQHIYVERDGQKKIVIGKGGQMLKKIGEQARHKLEALLKQRVHLFLQVKVQPNWATDIHHLRMLGLSNPKQ